MNLLRRFIVGFALVLLCTSITACGFTPIYQKQTDRNLLTATAQIHIETISERRGMLLRQALVDILQPQGRVAPLHYTLKIELTEQKSTLAIAKDATTTRAQMRHVANWALINNQTQQAIIRRQFVATSGYDILSSEFNTLVTEENARERNAKDLAERIALVITAYFKNPPAARPALQTTQAAP